MSSTFQVPTHKTNHGIKRRVSLFGAPKKMGLRASSFWAFSATLKSTSPFLARFSFFRFVHFFWCFFFFCFGGGGRGLTFFLLPRLLADGIQRWPAAHASRRRASPRTTSPFYLFGLMRPQVPPAKLQTAVQAKSKTHKQQAKTSTHDHHSRTRNNSPTIQASRCPTQPNPNHPTQTFPSPPLILTPHPPYCPQPTTPTSPSLTWLAR